MKKRIVLLGPPASGKGTQARFLFDKYAIPTVSTGQLLRAEAEAGTDLGKQAASFTSKGQLAPDELVIAVLQNWLGKGRDSYVFDGFPRTLAQATQLKPMLIGEMIPLELVILLNCDRETIEKRVRGRVTCQQCHQIFLIGLHVDSVSKPCPSCGGVLMRRPDDQPDVLAQRMVQYSQKTAPLIEFYKSEGILKEIDAARSAEEVSLDIQAVMIT